MADNRMLQLIIDKLSAFQKEVNTRFDKVDLELLKVNKRIDKLGYEIAEVSEGSPTRDEHEQLEKRISSVERKLVASN